MVRADAPTRNEGATTMAMLGEGTGRREIRSATPNPSPNRNMTVPNTSPAASDVCPRPAARRAAERPSMSMPNSSAPSTNAEIPTATANRAAPRIADSAPMSRMAAPTIRKRTARSIRALYRRAAGSGACLRSDLVSLDRGQSVEPGPGLQSLEDALPFVEQRLCLGGPPLFHEPFAMLEQGHGHPERDGEFSEEPCGSLEEWLDVPIPPTSMQLRSQTKR